MHADAVRAIVQELTTRPGHEKVRSLLYRLLVDGLGAKSSEIEFEERLPAVHGRLDGLWGYTVFEVKKDLRRELSDAENQLADYLKDKERTSGERHIGIATDGAKFIPYELGSSGLKQLGEFIPDVLNPRALLDWLDAAVCTSADIKPTPELVRSQLGKLSLAWAVAREELSSIWTELKVVPDAALKRQLWADYLQRVYGSSVDQDMLFFQHTYLSIVAKTIATHVLGVPVAEPKDLLEGRAFTEAGIHGVVESDFFDWPLQHGKGPALVKQIATQTARFRLREVQCDVLKGLYESFDRPRAAARSGRILYARLACTPDLSLCD